MKTKILTPKSVFCPCQPGYGPAPPKFSKAFWKRQ